MTPIELMRERFPQARDLGDWWKDKCPAHPDEQASFCFRERDDGSIAVKCHASCSRAEILRSMDLTESDLAPPRDASPRGSWEERIEATYDYQDEHGTLLFQTVRLHSPKDFRQRRPNDRGGWIWKLGDVRRILYRHAQVLTAAAAGATIYVAEGEKDVHTLEKWGLVATTNPMGAGKGKWRGEYSDTLRGAHVVLCEDNDATGREHVETVARSLRGNAASVRVLRFRELPEHGDVTDWVNLGGTKAALTRLTEAAPLWEPQSEGTAPLETSPVGSEKKNHATRLVEMALAAEVELFHTPEGEGFATFPANAHRETWPLNGRFFRQWLARLSFERDGAVPGGQAMQDAINTLGGVAQFDRPELPVYTRVAAHEGAYYLNLADAGWRAVRITADGWSIVTQPPVKFRQGKAMEPLPAPERGGSITALRPFVNIAAKDEKAWKLVVAWLLAALRPVGPYPILELHGEQGCAKTTTARVLRALVDPAKAGIRAEPENKHDLAITAHSNQVIALDNLSGIAPWLSDALCRLSTGGGFGKRQLFTNDEEALFDAMRPVILTGIGEIAARADLLDRALVLALPRIEDTHRQSEADFWRDFEAVRPHILGALLDGVAAGLRCLPETRLERSPRMADFAVWITAAERALGWEPGAFMAAYDENREDASNIALEASPLVAPLQALMRDKTEWSGPAETLRTELECRAPDYVTRRGNWPGNGRALSIGLQRIAPNLRAIGLEVEKRKNGGERTIHIRHVTPGDGGTQRGDANRADGNAKGDAKPLASLLDEAERDARDAKDASSPIDSNCIYSSRVEEKEDGEYAEPGRKNDTGILASFASMSIEEGDA